MKHDAVNHPKHYTGHPSGIECIQVTEHMGFNLGNALKYIWRCDLKGSGSQDLEFSIQSQLNKYCDGSSGNEPYFGPLDQKHHTPCWRNWMSLKVNEL